MRKDKKKVNKSMDETNTTTAVKGFLGGLKVNKRKGSEPWYLSREQLFSSLEEVITNLAFVNLLNEDESSPTLHQRAVPEYMNFIQHQISKAAQIQQRGGPRSAEEQKIFEFVLEHGKESLLKLSQLGKKSLEVKKIIFNLARQLNDILKKSGTGATKFKSALGREASGSTVGKLSSGIQNLLSFLQMKSEFINSKGGPTNPQEQDIINFQQKLNSTPSGLRNLFLRSVFSSFPEQIQNVAQQEFAKAGKIFKPNETPIWRFLELPNISFSLAEKFLKYFESHKQEIQKSNESVSKTMAQAAPTGVKGITIGTKQNYEKGIVDPEDQVGTLEDLGDEEDLPEEVGAGAEGEHFSLTDIMKQVRDNPSSSSLEKDLTSSDKDIDEKELRPFHKIENVDDEAALKKMPPDEFNKLGSKILLNRKGVYRNQAVKILAKNIQKDIGMNISPEQVNDLVDRMSRTVKTKDGSVYITLMKPNQFMSNASEQEQKIYPMIYKSFSPESVLSMKKNLLGKETKSSPLIDYVKDKMAQVWNKRLDQAKVGYERRELKKQKKSREDEAKKNQRSPEEIEKLRAQQKEKERKAKGLVKGGMEHPESPEAKSAVKARKEREKAESKAKWQQSEKKLQKGALDDLEDLEIVDKLQKAKKQSTEIGKENRKRKIEELKAKYDAISGKEGKGIPEERKKMLLGRMKDEIEELMFANVEMPNESIFNNIKLHELLLSPESTSKEKKVEVKEKYMDKAPIAKKKEFYPKYSINDWFEKR